MSDLPNVRTMTPADLDAVLAIEHRAFQEPWSRQSYEFELTQNRFSLPIVAEYQNTIVGHAVAWFIFDEFHIATIAIDPDYQGRGWGSYLLKAMLGMSAGAEYALLEVRASNTRAIRLYENYGFNVVGKRPAYYRNREDALVMKKDLIPQAAGTREDD